jgi:two-component system, OmpR family, sensor kinase
MTADLGTATPAPPATAPFPDADTSARRRRVGTAARLAIAHALVLTTVLGLAVLGLLHAFRTQTASSTSSSLVAEMGNFANAAAARREAQTLRRFTEGYLRTRALPQGELLVVTLPDGSKLGSAGSNWLLATPQVRRWARTPVETGSLLQVEHDDHTFQLASAPLVSRGTTVGTIVVAGDLTRAESGIDRVRNLAIGEAVLALLAGTASGYLLLRGLLRRIGRITATAADIGHGRLDRRLGDQGTDDEVGRLAQTFDEMTDRLSAAMLAQRRLLSDVSHQLRTPLTVARGHLEVLERTGATDPAEVRDTVALVVDEIDHMRALVERLLMLGRALEPDFVEPVPVDLRSFCADIVETCRVLADRDWGLSAVPDLVIDVDGAKLRGALLNLVDNAVRATGDGDLVALTAGEGRDGTVLLAVEDSGPGIPADARAEVLQRFQRGGAADSHGSGLGLAIVKAVAEAHGGALTLDESAFGGLRATLRLPASVRATVPEER